MKILITGICGFAGSRIALHLAGSLSGAEIFGIDNLARRGAAANQSQLRARGIPVVHGDIRLASDVTALAAADWVIDCAANPSVLAGISAQSGADPRQLLEHNLIGTLNLLEYCRTHHAGFVMLSSSRVYSIDQLNRIPLTETATRFVLADPLPGMPGLSADGISTDFSTEAPLSLYGATKRASEIMALEYGAAFDIPVWIDRCGVIAGPGQMGKPDQGIFSFWAYSYLLHRPLSFIGFNGTGRQVRDCITPQDVADLILLQLKGPSTAAPKIINIGGGNGSALSLFELNELCRSFFGYTVPVTASPAPRPYDIPWYISDNREAERVWKWRPQRTAEDIVLEICRWSKDNESWIAEISGV
jgi:CDP-paratose 2-epimerase